MKQAGEELKKMPEMQNVLQQANVVQPEQPTWKENSLEISVSISGPDHNEIASQLRLALLRFANQIHEHKKGNVVVVR